MRHCSIATKNLKTNRNQNNFLALFNCSKSHIILWFFALIVLMFSQLQVFGSKLNDDYSCNSNMRANT